MNCPHDITEMEMACHADGLCPLCLQDDYEKLLKATGELIGNLCKQFKIPIERIEQALKGDNGKS